MRLFFNQGSRMRRALSLMEVPGAVLAALAAAAAGTAEPVNTFCDYRHPRVQAPYAEGKLWGLSLSFPVAGRGQIGQILP